MRLSILFVTAMGCSPVPDPPDRVMWNALDVALSDARVVVVTEMGKVEIVGDPVPLPTQQSSSDSSSTTIPLVLPDAQAVAVGRAHACVISLGEVHCWGDQTNGALGAHRACAKTEYDQTLCASAPEIMPTLPFMTAIAAGDDVTCGIDREGLVFCFGSPLDGRLGGSRVPALGDPSPVVLPGPATRVIVQNATACAFVAGDVYCWGRGFGERATRLPLDGVVDVAIGPRHTCAIDQHGLACWGDNRNGQSGDQPGAYTCGTDAPTCTVGVTRIPIEATRVVVGERHSCAIGSDTRVWCWGSNEVGQLGREDAFLVGSPGIAVDHAAALYASYAKTCARKTDDTVWCWGEFESEEKP